MKKILSLFLPIMFSLVWAVTSRAFVNYEDLLPKKIIQVKLTGYDDYAPFGYFLPSKTNKTGTFASPFKVMMQDLAEKNNMKLNYSVADGSYPERIQDVRQGDTDILLGMYYDTKLFEGIEMLFPAAFMNPITVFMLPNRIDEVKTTDDLKKLKGVRIQKEIFSDFVEEQLKDYNLITVADSYGLFEQLFTQKADYILASQYYGLIEASKLGLRNQISVAKQTLWQIPMFVGVSKLSRNRKLLEQKIARWLDSEENRKLLQQEIINIVDDAEINAQGIVPPNFDNKPNVEQ